MSSDEKDDQTVGPERTYSRREVLAALTKYSAAAGGAAVTIVTAEGLVSAASAYPSWLSDFCQANPGHWICTWEGWDQWETRDSSGTGRIQY